MELKQNDSSIADGYMNMFWQGPRVVVAAGLPPWLAVAALALAAAWCSRRRCTLPGPPALPLLGTRWLYFWRYRIDQLHEAHRDMMERYGPVWREVCGGVSGATLVHVSSRATLECVLRARSRYPVRPPTPITLHYRRAHPERYASAGMVNEQGATWHFLRSQLTGELTSPATLARFVPALNRICDDFLDLLLARRGPDCKVSSFHQLTNRMGLESSCALMLGKRMTFLSPAPSRAAADLAGAVKVNFAAQRDSYYGWPLWRYIPTPLYARYQASEDHIHKVITDIVEAASRSTPGDDGTESMRAIFTSILDNPEVDMRDKKAVIIDFITAGIETLANSLCFLLYLMAKNPAAQERAYKELLSQSGAGREGIECEMLSRLPYTKACVHEAFRLLPTAPALARILEHPVQADGHTLDAGSFVLCQTMLACRREENFTRASEFRPERWLRGEACGTCGTCETSGACGRSETAGWVSSPSLVVPFGAGRRMCPGKRFVELELNLLLAKLMQRFRVEYDGGGRGEREVKEGGRDMKLQFDFLLAPAGDVTFTLIDRERQQGRILD